MPRQTAAGTICAIADRPRSRRAAPSRRRARPPPGGSRRGPRPSERIGRARRRAGRRSSCRRQSMPSTCMRFRTITSRDAVRCGGLSAWCSMRPALLGTLARARALCPHGADLGRLSRHRRLSRRHHRVRLVVRAVSEDHPRLFPDRPLGALVGDLLHRSSPPKRARSRSSAFPPTAYAGNMTFLQLAFGYVIGRVHRQRAVHSGLFPRRPRSRRTSCCSGGSAAREERCRPSSSCSRARSPTASVCLRRRW